MGFLVNHFLIQNVFGEEIGLASCNAKVVLIVEV